MNKYEEMHASSPLLAALEAACQDIVRVEQVEFAPIDGMPGIVLRARDGYVLELYPEHVLISRRGRSWTTPRANLVHAGQEHRVAAELEVERLRDEARRDAVLADADFDRLFAELVDDSPEVSVYDCCNDCGSDIRPTERVYARFYAGFARPALTCKRCHEAPCKEVGHVAA